MFCEKCGTENAENAIFCGKCGARLNEAKIKNKVKISPHISKKVKWAVCISVICLLCIAGIGVFVLKGKKDTEEYNRNLAKAKEFMEAMDYYNAEISYKRAKNLLSWQLEPYIGLTEIYLAQEKMDAAKDILGQAENILDRRKSAGRNKNDKENEKAIKDKRAELDALVKFKDIITKAKEYMAEKNTMAAMEKYAEAIEIRPDRKEGYNGLADIYIVGCSYDKAEEVIKQGLKNGVDLSQKQTKLENAKEKLAFMISLRDSIKTDPAAAWELLQEARNKCYPRTYLQNNKIVQNLEDGNALVYANTECYSGEIRREKRNGSGTQIGSYNYSYFIATGNWENNILNGQAVLYYDRYNSEEPFSNMIVSGNFTSGLYDGEMWMEWKKESEGATHKGFAHAANGILSEIATDANGYKIYVKSDDGWYWRKPSLEGEKIGVPPYIEYFE